MQFAEYETLKVEGPDEDGVVVVTLNRPEARNSFSHEMHFEFADVVRVLRNPEGVGAVVLTGAGKGFSSGGDMSMIDRFSKDPDYVVTMMDEGMHLVTDMLRIRPPMVAAINGHAMGLGATIGLICDIVVMAESAKIADTHVKAGIVAGDGGTVIWPLLIGTNRAKELLMTGEVLDAQTAHQIGLVNHLVADDQVMPKALQIARDLARGPRDAIAWTKQAINVPLLRDVVAHMPLSISLESRSMALPDVAEGVASFREKRPAVWPSAQGT